MTDPSVWAVIQRLETRIEVLEGRVRQLGEVPRHAEIVSPEAREKAEKAREEYVAKVFARFSDPKTGELTEEGARALEDSWMSDGVG